MMPFIAQTLFAQDTPEKENKASTSSEISLQLSTMPGAKLGYIKHFHFPFLQGESFLTKDNNIDIALTGEISPISVNGYAEAVWTPAAFFQLYAGGRIGSGWNITLFGKKVKGIGINRPNEDGRPEHTGKAFDGMLWKAQTGAALQADLAAAFPGDWNHVVVRSYHEINYRGYTAAGKGESWYYEDDNGLQAENCNGFNYYGNLLLGYQMPFFFNMLAFLIEADLYLYDTPGRSKWGDDLIRWTYALVLSFDITKKINITVLTQYWTRRNFLEPNWSDLYYRYRTVDKSNPTHIEFYRAGIAFTFKM